MSPNPYVGADVIEAASRLGPHPGDSSGAICALVNPSGVVVQANRRLRALLPGGSGARFDALLEPASAGVWRSALERAAHGAASEIELVVGPGGALGTRYRCVLEPGDGPLVWVFAEPFGAGGATPTAARCELEQARAQALSDPLTGLPNRRQADRRLEACVARALAQQQPLGCIMADLDHFKRVNDALGHCAGDRVLCATATALIGAVRAPDHVARYGGDEFLILLPNTNLKGAMALAARLGLKLAKAHAGSAGQPSTASFGVAALRPGNLPQPCWPAPMPLCCAQKRAGRNRVECG